MPKQQQKKVVTVTSKPKGKPSQTTTTVTVSKSPKSSNKKRRPRRSRKGGNQNGSTRARTTNDVQTTLAKGISNMSMGSSPWMSCRLSAMAPRNVPSIPDGQSGKHVNVCFYSQHTLSFAADANGQAFRMYLFPWLPAPLVVNSNEPGSKVLVDGSPVPTFNRAGAAFGSSFIAPFSTDTSPGAHTVNPYGAAKLRFSSIGMRIRYTGPAQTASGVIMVSKFPATLGQPVTSTSSSATTSPPSSGVFFAEYTSVNTVQTFAPVGCVGFQFDGPDLGSAFVNSTCGVQMYRPEQGAIIRLSHDSNEFRQVPWYETYAAVLEHFTSTTVLDNNNSLLTNDPTFIQRSRGGLCAYDNDWTPVSVSISGYNPDAKFMVEVCVCAEIIPSVASVTYAMTKEGSANSPSEIKMAEAVLRNEGPAQPLVR